MGVLMNVLMRSVFLRRTLALCIGGLYAIPVLGSILFSLIKSRGRILQTKPYSKKPDCLQDPVYGEHKIASLEDVNLHYVVNGSEGKPLMVFVHGFPECWYSWRFQLREFQHDYRVVAVDQRGYNTSSKPPGVFNYTVDKLVDDIKQLIPILGYEKCTLVGHDWGGVTCWGVAMKHPELVERLIIMNAPHPKTFLPYLTSSLSQFRKSWYMFLFQLPYLPEFLYWSNDMINLRRVFMSRRAGVRSGKMTEEDLQAYKYVFSGKGAFTGPLNYIRAMSSVTDLISGPSEVTCPTLIILGDCDQFLDTKLINLAEPFVPRLEKQIAEGASHWVQMDQPETVNKYMRKFLSQTSCKL